MLTLWTLSLLAALGTGWLVFADGGAAAAPPMIHAVFLLSVLGFVVCSLWGLARGFSSEERRERGGENAGPRDGELNTGAK